MGMIKLEPRIPKNVNGISIDPNPSWNFNDLLSELSSLENKLHNNASDSPLNPKPFTKTAAREIGRVGRREKNEETKKAFVMRVDNDDEMGESDGEDGIEHRSLVLANRFDCNDMYLSESDDDSNNEEMQQLQVSVMDKMHVVEGCFLELTHEHQLGIKDEIRNQITALETQLVAEKEKSMSALVQVEKNTAARQQLDRKMDLHYQRKIAEALDNHLTTIQRDHEHRSQIEERRIRDDAALEEAKRKEKALQEEKLRQQKAKEDEVKREAAKRAEEERKAAEEAEKLAKEAADKLAKENSAKEAVNAQRGTTSISQIVSSDVPKEVKSAGNVIRASGNALKLEEKRLQTYKELENMNQSIISGSHTDFKGKERELAKVVRQINGLIDIVRTKTTQLLKIFNEPVFPQSVTAAIFARKVISCYEKPNSNSSTFACGHVIVYVSAQVPAVMDCLLAEFHKACIYTVPKHIMYSKTAFETEEAYYKAIGFREEDGEVETTPSYLKRVTSLMKLYGALVQTEAQGVQNIHGLEHGWAWLARFLNVIPATRHTAVALEAFLGMAGFALHRKYQFQFRKMLNTIINEFVPAVNKRADASASSVVVGSLEAYIKSEMYRQEPEGWALQHALSSRTMAPEADYRQEQYHHTPDRRFTYQR
ncbi:Protein GLE1 [Bienertia sinuspersici]